MSDSSLNKIVLEIKKSKDELKNLILASETRLQLKIEELKGRISEIEEENNFLKNKIEYLERDSKQKNIVIYGLNKTPAEIDIDFVCRELTKTGEKTEKSDISNFYCLGKDANCPLKVEFTTKIKKNCILKNSHKLKNTGIGIVPDLTVKQREDRKFLKTQLERQLTRGKQSYIRGNRLIIGSETYSIEELRRSEDEEEVRRNNSTPATPTQALIREPPDDENVQRTKNTPVIKRIEKVRTRSNK